MITRALTQKDFRGWMSAQTGQAARDLWYEWHRLVGQSPLAGRFTTRLSNGEERMTFPPTGGFVRTFPPTPDSLHGKQGDAIFLDEVFSYTMELGEAIMQATIPTQATRPWRQTWIISTAGSETSDWMRGWVHKGRESLTNPESTIAHFEWAAPEEAPWDDPDTWARFHPAYGLTQSAESFVIAAEQLGEKGFRRAYLNQWPASQYSWRNVWPTLEAAPIPPDSPIVIAADADPRLQHATIAAAAPGDVVPVEVIDYRPGHDWVLDRLKELAARHAAPVHIVRNGPLGYLLLDLERAGVPIRPVTATEYQDAVSKMQTMVVNGQIAHQHDPRVDQAVAAVQEPTLERPTWRRKDTAVDISPLVAVTVAAWSASTNVGPQLL